MDQELLDLVYEAAAIPEYWAPVLERLCAVSGSNAAALIAVTPEGALRHVATQSYGAQFARYLENPARYDNVRPARVMAIHPMGFASDLEVSTIKELDDDLIYTELLRPNGFAWTAGTAIPVPSGDLLVFDFARHTHRDPYSRSDMEQLNAYRPHVARAALLAHRLGLAQAVASANAMQAIGLPAATINSAGAVTASNALFDALSPRILAGAFGRVRLVERPSDQLLREAFQRSGDESARAVRSIPMPARYDEPALVLHVIPLRRAANDLFVRSTALLVVTPVTAPDAPMTEVLTGLFDLTPAEARVAGGVSRGMSLDEIAAAHALSKETVRTQLKAVMSKTGTERQSELALLLSGARLPTSGRNS